MTRGRQRNRRQNLKQQRPWPPLAQSCPPHPRARNPAILGQPPRRYQRRRRPRAGSDGNGRRGGA
eukprot:11161288-Lingulodinium_polyedra.AAC.1